MASNSSSHRGKRNGRRSGGGVLRRFRRSEDGASTVEFIIWIPGYLAILMLSFDIGLTLFTMSRMWDAARYTARSMSIGQISTQADATQYAQTLLPGHATYTITTDLTNANVVVSISSSTVSPSAGFLELFAPGTLTAAYAMRREVN